GWSTSRRWERSGCYWRGRRSGGLRRRKLLPQVDEQESLLGAALGDARRVAGERLRVEPVAVAVDEVVDRAFPLHLAVGGLGEDRREGDDLSVLQREEDVARAAERVGEEVRPAALQVATDRAGAPRGERLVLARDAALAGREEERGGEQQAGEDDREGRHDEHPSVGARERHGNGVWRDRGR